MSAGRAIENVTRAPGCFVAERTAAACPLFAIDTAVSMCVPLVTRLGWLPAASGPDDVGRRAGEVAEPQPLAAAGRIHQVDLAEGVGVVLVVVPRVRDPFA